MATVVSGVGMGNQPTDEEIITLIQNFYQAGNQAPQWIDRQLQQLQRSQHGWKMADRLLDHPDPTVKFYGAQTFTVKINSDYDTLEQEDIPKLENRLVHRTVLLLEKEPNTPAFVVRKLCATLALLYTAGRGIKPKNCIKKLLCSSVRFKEVLRTISHDELQTYADSDETGLAIPDEELERYTTPNQMGFLDARQWQFVLWFIEELASEGTKMQTGYPPEVISHCKSMLEANVLDAITIIGAAISPSMGNEYSEVDVSRCNSAMACFRVWVFCAQQTWTRESDQIQLLRGLLKRILRWFSAGPMDDTTKELVELLSHYPSFFQRDHLATISTHITGPWGVARIKEVLEGDPEADSFVQLMVAFGDATVEQLAEMNEHDISQRFLEMIHLLTDMPGIPGIDEEYRTEVLEFWNQFVEYVTDLAPLEDDAPSQPWIQGAKIQIGHLLEELSVKLRPPEPAVLHEIDDESLKAFKDFRQEVADLLQSSYPLFGPELVIRYVSLCIEAVNHQRWLEVEVALFCLNALGIIQEQMDRQFADSVLTNLFSSPLYPQLASSDASIPNWTRRAALSTLGEYASYFSRNIEQLPAAFNFILSSVDSPLFAEQAARSIWTICSACRRNLVTELNGLLQQYSQFLTSPTASIDTKEKFIGAIAFVIQALPSDDAKATAMSLLLHFIENDLEAAGVLFSEGRTDESLPKSLEALGCLVSVGKALQAPHDHAVDLEANPKESDFWQRGPGMAIQTRILGIVKDTLSIHGNIGEVVDKVCEVFKAGFVETQPGPFVLDPHATVEFFRKTTIHTPQLVDVLSMICSFLRAYTPAYTPHIPEEVGDLLDHILVLIRSLGQPHNDPEIAHSIVEVLVRYSPRYIAILYRGHPRENLLEIFNFTVLCIQAPEPLTKRSALNFWVEFFDDHPSKPSLTDYWQTVQLESGSPLIKDQSMHAIWSHFGPGLATILTSQIAGVCLRSDIEYFVKPITAMMRVDPRSREWFEQAINELAQVNGPSMEDAKIFLQKIRMQVETKDLKANPLGIHLKKLSIG
jgi:hypothetical protein